MKAGSAYRYFLLLILAVAGSVAGAFAARVSTPEFSPGSGTYNGIQSITITCATSGATIRYTTDGSNPTSSKGTIYSGAFQISSSLTVKAIAYRTGYTNSYVATATYVINLPAVSDPAFTPGASDFTSATSIAISSSTDGASIRYTIDGTTPTASTGLLYYTPILIDRNYLVKAIAFKSGYPSSNVVSAFYTVKVTTPAISPDGGHSQDPREVSISCLTAGATIRYTLDGSQPGSSNGTVYSSSFTLSGNTTVKAIAYKSGMNDSDVASSSFTFGCAPPAAEPGAGLYNQATSVTLTSATAGAAIRYTTDGSSPSEDRGTLYQGPITIDRNLVLKAVAYKSGLNASDVVETSYQVRAEGPEMSPAPGNYERPQTVTLTSSLSGGIIYYSVNGSDPDPNTGTLFEEPVPVNASLTLKAMVVADGYAHSLVQSGYYEIGLSDTDGDGVVDVEDDYPNDRDRALNNYYPGETFGTLAFEDLWPAQGDYDMNDVVVDYRFRVVTDASNHLVEMDGEFILRAAGAALKNGFGFQFPGTDIPISAMEATGHALTTGLVSLDDKGFEEGQSLPTLIVFENSLDILKHPGSGSGVNTDPDAAWVEPDTLTIHVSFSRGKYTDEDLRIADFNPFIFVNQNRGREVHLIDFAPTSLADLSLLGTSGDYSAPAEGLYYRTVNNLPWALNLPEKFDYPKEKETLIRCYLHFADWAQSSGTEYPDWYKNASGYRNTDRIYSR